MITLLGCNTAPIDYRDIGEGEARAPYTHPTDVICAPFEGEPGVERIDGFLFCQQSEAWRKIPVDEPLYRDCSAPGLPAVDVLAVYDGVAARAWSLPLLQGRELVNDDWFGEPLLVDW
ncbi:MAG: hypothetical protein ABMA64_06715 [Myxococcota bacterium]